MGAIFGPPPVRPVGALTNWTKSVPLALSIVATLFILFVSCSLLLSNQEHSSLSSSDSVAFMSSKLFQKVCAFRSLAGHSQRVEALKSETKNVSGEVELLRDTQRVVNADSDQTRLSEEEVAALSQRVEALNDSEVKHGKSERLIGDLSEKVERLGDPPQGGEGAQADKKQLEQCVSGTLLGGWRDSTFVPLPLDVLDVFLEEAEGRLSDEQKAGLHFEGKDFDSVTSAFPALSHAPLTQNVDGQLTFKPPCYYHTYSSQEIVRLFKGKWLYFLGDSNTRALVLGLLTFLDPTHNQPFDEQLWFNSSDTVRWPHVEAMDYFLREDGSILSKFGATGRSTPGKDTQEPTEPYSVRISYWMQFDARRTLTSLPDALGNDDWRPDFLYFNTGSWDANEAVTHNVAWSEIEDSYAPLFDKIATTCKPERQVCVWGTLTSNVHFTDRPYQHSRLALAQWRQMARIVRAQQKAGKPRSLHFLDHFWPSHVSDQGKGGHYGHMVNIWDAQRLMNVYHGIVQETVDLTPPASSPVKGKGDAPQCQLEVDGHFATAKCDCLPESVAFGEGCVMERSDPGQGDAVLHMWERNCETKVTYSKN